MAQSTATRFERLPPLAPAEPTCVESDVRDLRGHIELLHRESPAIVYRRDASPPYAFHFVSDNVELILGYPSSELVGDAAAFRQRLVAEDGARLDDALESVHADRSRTTYRLMDGSGALRWIEDEMRLVVDAAGVTVCIVGHLMDVTERQAIMDELFQSEERYALAVQGSQAGLWDLDVPSNRLYLSPRLIELFGYLEDELGPHTDFAALLDHIHPDDRARVESALQAHLGGLGAFDLECRARGKEGPYRWFHACGQANWVGADLRPARMAGWLADITERRRLEEELRQAQKMEAIGRLAGGVAHDFNNLLTVILGYARMVGEQLPDDSAGCEDAREIVVAAERAAGLTRQLLAFSRQQVLEPRVVDLDGIVENLEKMLRRLIGADVDLQALRSTEPLLLRIDPGQLEQVILNLVVNARDAMPDGGRIRIVTRRADGIPQHATAGAARVGEGPFVVLSVSDSGVGMDATTQARIFEPFFTTKDSGKGTGLGLSTVYGIVAQSGGRIAVDSELGRGTTFHIYFSRCAGEADADAPAGHHAGARSFSGRGGTVLLVEDEDQVRAVARQILERGGFTVIAARNGREAVSLAAQTAGPIHLLLTDVIMPGINGPQLHEELLRSRPTLRALFMSGYAENRNLPPVGAPFLQKPFMPNALVARVRDLVDSNPPPVSEFAPPDGAGKVHDQ